MPQITVQNEQELSDVAAKLVTELKPPITLLLDGELGAGKTTFTRYLTQHLNCTSLATSPTFTLMQHYKGDKVVHHIDLYRCNTQEDILGLDLERYTQDPNAITIIEWANKLQVYTPEPHMKLFFSYADQPTARLISIEKSHTSFSKENTI